jgi:hypothetical protein
MGSYGLWRGHALLKKYHGWAFEDADLPGASSSAKQPAALAGARRLWAG